MYEKPMIIASDDLSEGVYLASGSSDENCWRVTVKRSHQHPVCGRKSTKFQIDMQHLIKDQSHHDRKPQRLYLVFDHCVDVLECSEAHLVGCGRNVSQIEVDFYTCDNGNEHIGWGGLAVAYTDSDCKVNITKAWMTD